MTVCILASLHTALCGSRSYQRPITDDELKSPITWAIDKSFSRFADEYQSDKSGRGSSYHYIYRYAGWRSCMMQLVALNSTLTGRTNKSSCGAPASTYLQ